MNNTEDSPELNRRDFLKNTSLATVMAMMGGMELRAGAAEGAGETPLPVGPAVRYGVIGAGQWGREIISTLAQLPNAPVVAICDYYAPWRRRAKESAPQAELFDDYQKLLAAKDVQAVIVATPTPDHRDIAVAALRAGKHVYCEAPLANSIDDAKTIARAARDALKVVFQSGLQERAHPQRHFLHPFIRTGALGRQVMARAQWHKKESWARSAATPEREKELNWRLHQATSIGLIGEIGIHQLDAVSWFLGARPTAVTGFSSLILYNDGRDVPDTVQAVLEFPDGANFLFDATLCNSFDSQYEIYYGSDSAIMVRDSKAWQFKEVDAPNLEWEVYARKDTFYTETGIALVADATKQTAQGRDATTAAPTAGTPLFYALEAFTANAGRVGAAVEDYIASFGEGDMDALRDSVAAVKKHPAAGWREGLEATVLAIKANEAAVERRRITLDKEFFEL